MHSAEAEIEAMREHLDLLQSLGSSVFVIAETSNAIHGRRDVPLTDSPVLSDEDWKVLGERLTTVADITISEPRSRQRKSLIDTSPSRVRRLG